VIAAIATSTRSVRHHRPRARPDQPERGDDDRGAEDGLRQVGDRAGQEQDGHQRHQRGQLAGLRRARRGARQDGGGDERPLRPDDQLPRRAEQGVGDRRQQQRPLVPRTG
jgi:hypothetical protein